MDSYVKKILDNNFFIEWVCKNEKCNCGNRIKVLDILKIKNIATFVSYNENGEVEKAMVPCLNCKKMYIFKG